MGYGHDDFAKIQILKEDDLQVNTKNLRERDENKKYIVEKTELKKAYESPKKDDFFHIQEKNPFSKTEKNRFKAENDSVEQTEFVSLYSNYENIDTLSPHKSV